MSENPSTGSLTEIEMSAQWQLSGCCGNEERIFLGFYAAYVLIFVFISKSSIMKPMRLLAVFLHEFSHAFLCWITGGKVEAIEVNDNEGGVTKYRGGCRICIIPAGYVGCAFWAGLFVAMSGSRIGGTIVAGGMSAALLISLCYKPNGIVVGISLVFTGINVIAILIDWFVFTPLVEYLSLFYGVFIGFYSVLDIYDDLVTRTAEGSDAVACHQVLPCCIPRCVGVQFWIVAFIFQVVGLYMALVWMVSI